MLLVDKYHLETAIPVKIDDGGVGGGVTDRLREIKRGDPDRFWWLSVIPVKFGERIRHRYYYDTTTYMMSIVKKLLQTTDDEGHEKPVELILPDDADLAAQLSGRKYGISEQSKLRIESKKDVKARGLPSLMKATVCFYSVCRSSRPRRSRLRRQEERSKPHWQRTRNRAQCRRVSSRPTSDAAPPAHQEGGGAYPGIRAGSLQCRRLDRAACSAGRPA